MAASIAANASHAVATLELRHLRYFVITAELQNFHRAAERLNLVQPALSRQIRDLETQLDVALFERLPRGVRLTPAGRNYAAEARKILAAVDAANQTAQRIHRGEQGELRIGITDMASTSSVVMIALRRFRTRLPLVNLQLLSMSTRAQIEALQAGRLDVGLVAESRDLPETLEQREIASYRELLAMPNDHPLAARDTVNLADLREDEFIIPAITPLMRDYFIAELRSVGFEPRIVHSVPSTEMALRFVAAGAGVAVVNSSALSGASPCIVMKPLADIELKRRLMIAWRKADADTLPAQFREMIIEGSMEPIG